MTVLAQNEKLTATFQAVCDHLTHADPNDFDSQIPPTTTAAVYHIIRGAKQR